MNKLIKEGISPGTPRNTDYTSNKWCYIWTIDYRVHDIGHCLPGDVKLTLGNHILLFSLVEKRDLKASVSTTAPG